jgi:hypothetical protein
VLLLTMLLVRRSQFAILLMAAFTAGLNAADKKLTIEHMALAQSEDATRVPSDFRFLPGDIVFFSCQVAGYAKRAREDDSLVDLEFQIDVRDAKGLPLIPVENGKVAERVTAEDKEWSPKIRHTIALPGLAETGQYQITIKVKDNFGNSSAEASIPLLVQGTDVPASDTLIVRNFRFLRTEEDKDPLKTPAYRPGDTVWARFEMTGYKLGEGNSFDVEYGLKVLRPGGDTTYEQAKAAEEKNQSFYPQRHTPGVLSLTLPKDLKAGEYTIVLTVRDNLGKQTYETAQKFQVE